MIQIAFQFTHEELFKGMMAISKGRTGTKVSRVIGFLFILGNLIALLSSFFINRPIFWPALFLLFFSLFMTFYLNILIWFQVKTLVRGNAQITKPMTYTFNNTDFELRGESFSTRMNYATLCEVKELGDFILLKVSECSGNTIPKRAFSVEQLALLKEIIQSIPNIKTKFSSNTNG